VHDRERFVADTVTSNTINIKDINNADWMVPLMVRYASAWWLEHRFCRVLRVRISLSEDACILWLCDVTLASFDTSIRTGLIVVRVGLLIDTYKWNKIKIADCIVFTE